MELRVSESFVRFLHCKKGWETRVLLQVWQWIEVRSLWTGNRWQSAVGLLIFLRVNGSGACSGVKALAAMHNSPWVMKSLLHVLLARSSSTYLTSIISLSWWAMLSCLNFGFSTKQWDFSIQSLYSRIWWCAHDHNSSSAEWCYVGY